MNFPVAFALLALTGTGCAEPRSILLGGVVLDAPRGEGQPAPGVEVTVLDADLAPYDQATTDEAGAFELRVAAAQDMFLELRGEGKVTTLFAGEAGIFDLGLAEGALYVLSEARPAELAATFGACAGDGTGGIAEGEVRAYLPGEEESEVSLVGNAWVVVYDEDNDPIEACYLDEEGAPAPEDQGMTNATGRFAVFGLAPGPHVLEVSYNPGAGGEDTGMDPADTLSWFYKVNMVEGGLAPFYPAWVEF
jgi:hypothetical protein